MGNKYPKNEMLWFELTTGADPSHPGRACRYYQIRCRRCAGTAAYHATGMSTDRMRKKFLQSGWDIGKRPNLHTCPECLTNHHVPVVVQEQIEQQLDSVCASADFIPPPEPEPELKSEPIYECSFCDATSVTHTMMGGRINAAGEYIAHICTDCVRMLVELLNDLYDLHKLPVVELKPEPFAHDAQLDNDDDVADWYKQLQERRNGAKL